MAEGTLDATLLITGSASGDVVVQTLGPGSAAACSRVGPDRKTPNEDGVLLLSCDDRRAVLAVADGFGGQPAGDQAAALALQTLAEAVTGALAAGDILRAGILNGFERANAAVMELGVGAATTLVVIEAEEDEVRSYHVGDAAALVVSQRGRLRMQTVAHSPVGYALEAGLLEEREAMHHDERHIVSNMVGAPDMRIEIGSALRLRRRDTVLLASDGLFDNLHIAEILDAARRGPLAQATLNLAQAAERRMTQPEADQPSKPDDLTCVLFRLSNGGRGK